MQCRWCGTEFADEDLVVLDISMPNYKGPHIRIINNLCESCSLKARTALADVEVQVRKQDDDQEDDHQTARET